MKALVVAAIFLILISGCNYVSSVSSDRNVDQNFRTGSQGLDLQFLPNSPPDRIYDTDPFDAVIEVRNEGATDIEVGSNSRIYLSGFDDTIISGISPDGVEIGDLEGKDQYMTEGDFTHLEFEGIIRDLGDRNIDDYPVTLLATACYNYETVAQAMVCLDPDPFGKAVTDKVCDATSSPSMGTQGAPIAVTSVDVEPITGRTKFKISISNVGGGTVFKDGYEYVTRCSPYSQGLEYDDIDYVTLESVEISNVDITDTCKPLRNGQIKLNDGRADIVCERAGLSGPAITTPLTIKLRYGYRNSVSKDIEVIATPE